MTLCKTKNKLSCSAYKLSCPPLPSHLPFCCFPVLEWVPKETNSPRELCLCVFHSPHPKTAHFSEGFLGRLSNSGPACELFKKPQLCGLAEQCVASGCACEVYSAICIQISGGLSINTLAQKQRQKFGLRILSTGLQTDLAHFPI